MFLKSKITKIYCMADDFLQRICVARGKYIIEDKKTKHRNKPNRMYE